MAARQQPGRTEAGDAATDDGDATSASAATGVFVVGQFHDACSGAAAREALSGRFTPSISA